MREDVQELVSDLTRLRELTATEVSTGDLISAVDTARNCIQNLARQIDNLENQLDELERKVERLGRR